MKASCRIAEQYLKKGAKVYLEGQLQTRKWTDKDGAERYRPKSSLQGFNSQLTMLDRAGGGGADTDSGISAQPARAPRASASPMPAWPRQGRHGRRNSVLRTGRRRAHLLAIVTLAMLPLAVWHARRHPVARHRKAMISIFSAPW